MQFVKFTTLAAAACLTMAACNESNEKKAGTSAEPAQDIKEEVLSYGTDSLSFRGFAAYNAADSSRRPVVIVVPEWWGLNDYPKMRARELAKLGYLAVVADFYGEGKVAENPGEAQKLAMPFYINPAMAQQRFEAALSRAKGMPMADTGRLAAIGYCFGGAQVLNMARLGEPLDAVVSFHGNLIGVPADKAKLKAAILVCHGEADTFIPQAEVDAFKKQMDSVGASYTFKSYPGSTHAFTNPAATATGKKFDMPIAYNAAADSASWNEMKRFFANVFRQQ